MTPPVPLPDCQRCGRPAHEHVDWRCPGRSPNVAIIVIGAVIALAGALIWFQTRTDAALCGSALVTALDPRQCQVYSTVHTVAGLGFLAGAVQVVIGWLRKT